jgi:WD40 repeat protein
MRHPTQGFSDVLYTVRRQSCLQDSLLVFWDPATGQPTRTLQRPHAAGVAAVALSPDASQMATLSAVDSSSGVQEVS